MAARVPDIAGAIARHKASIHRRSKQGITQLCMSIYSRSGALVPKETEALFDSRHWRVDPDPVVGWRGVVGYAPEDFVKQGTDRRGRLVTRRPADYVIYVHEDMTAHHPVGQAKFLQQPAEDRAANVEAFNEGFIRG